MHFKFHNDIEYIWIHINTISFSFLYGFLKTNIGIKLEKKNFLTREGGGGGPFCVEPGIFVCRTRLFCVESCILLSNRAFLCWTSVIMCRSNGSLFAVCLTNFKNPSARRTSVAVNYRYSRCKSIWKFWTMINMDFSISIYRVSNLMWAMMS